MGNEHDFNPILDAALGLGAFVGLLVTFAGVPALWERHWKGGKRRQPTPTPTPRANRNTKRNTENGT